MGTQQKKLPVFISILLGLILIWVVTAAIAPVSSYPSGSSSSQQDVAELKRTLDSINRTLAEINRTLAHESDDMQRSLGEIKSTLRDSLGSIGRSLEQIARK